MTSRALAYAPRTTSLNGNRVAEWAPGGSNVLGTQFGWQLAAVGQAGNVSVPVLDDDALRTAMPAVRHATTAVAGAGAGLVSTDTMCWRGDAVRRGGFCFAVRFALAATARRAFIGLSAASGGAMVTADPSTRSNAIGIGFDASPATGPWMLVRSSGTQLATPEEIVGSTRDVADVLDLLIACGPNGGTPVLRLVNLTTGAILLDNVRVSGIIPAADVFLRAHVVVGNGPATIVSAIDVFSATLEVPDGASDVDVPSLVTPGTLSRDGVFDVRDFGALGDGTNDDSAAFRSALSAIGAANGCGILLVPPGDYKLASDLDIEDPVILRGVAPGNEWSKSRLKFEAYKGIRVHNARSGPNKRDGSGAVIQDLGILCGHGPADPDLRSPAFPTWADDATYTASVSRVMPPGPRYDYPDDVPPLAGTPGASFEYYYECVYTGVVPPAATKPAFETARKVNPSTERAPDTGYAVGDVVRATGTGKFHRLFVCTTAGTTDPGPEPPLGWSFTVDDTTLDGTVVWTTFDAEGYFIADGGTLEDPGTGPVWACRVAAGIYAQTRVHVFRTYVQNALCAALHLQAEGPDAVVPGVIEGWSARELRTSASGCGIVTRGHVRGGTASGCHLTTYDSDAWAPAAADRSVTVAERSIFENVYFAFHAEATEGPVLDVTEGSNRSTVFGPYTEGSMGPMRIQAPGFSIFGGHYGTLPAGDSVFYGAPLPKFGDAGIPAPGSFGGGFVRASSTNGTLTATLKPDGASVLGFSAADDATPYAWTYETAGAGFWGLAHNGNVALALSDDLSALGPGHAWTPNGLHVGTAGRVRISNGTAAPGGGGTRGDVVLNRAAAVGQPAWWQRTNSGWVTGPVLT